MNVLLKKTSFPNWHWFSPCDYREHFKCAETPTNSGRKLAGEVGKFVNSF